MRPRPEPSIEVAISDDRNPDILRTEAYRAIPLAQDRENDLDLRFAPGVLALRGGELRSVGDGRLDHEPCPAHAQPVDAHVVFGVRGLKSHDVTSRTGPLSVYRQVLGKTAPRVRFVRIFPTGSGDRHEFVAHLLLSFPLRGRGATSLSTD